MSNIYIAGIAMTVFGRHLERSLEDMAGEALQGALPAATVNDDDVFELRVLTEAELAEVVPAWGQS